MRHSLRLRLLLMTGLVSLVAIAAVAVFSSRITTRQFSRYIVSGTETDLERYSVALTRHYRERGGWDGVQTALDQVGAGAGKALILVDDQRRILAATAPFTGPRGIDVGPNHLVHYGVMLHAEQRTARGLVMNTPHVRIENERGETAGILYVVPFPAGGASHEALFVGAVNRSLWWAALLAGAAALLAAFALARRILRPIEALTHVVRRMAGGDLAQRVEIQSNDEIGELARAFNGMADGLARTEQLRRNLVNDVTHELRTPLTNLRCWIEALQDGLLAPSAGAFQSLHEEALLLKRLVDDLQELALAEAGQLRVHCEPLQAAELVPPIVSSFAAQAAAKGVALQTIIPADLPAVYADAERCGQILRNLLANALAHTPAGGRIEIRAQAACAQVEIRVTDSGAGIASEHLPNIFERFYRVDSARARATGGAGLGLAIVKQLVELQGGRVRAESTLGQFTAFTIALPVSAANPPRS